MKTTCKLKGNVTCYLKEATLQKGFCRHISGGPRRDALWRKHIINVIWRWYSWQRYVYSTYLKSLSVEITLWWRLSTLLIWKIISVEVKLENELYLKKFSEDILWRRRLKFSVRETVWREEIEDFWKKISEAKRKARWSRKS